MRSPDRAKSKTPAPDNRALIHSSPVDRGGSPGPSHATPVSGAEEMRGQTISSRHAPAADYRLHPSTRIVIYGLVALVLPVLSLWQLALFACIAALTLPGRYREVLSLFKRSRWLLLLLPLTYAYSLPGEAVWPQAGAFSPTQEGLAQGLLQVLRLSVLLLLLDALVLRMPTAALLSGIYLILAVFAPFGLDRARATVRLALTLEAIQRPPALSGLHVIIAGPLPESSLPDRYTLIRKPLSGRDWLALTLMFLIALWLYA